MNKQKLYIGWMLCTVVLVGFSIGVVTKSYINGECSIDHLIRDDLVFASMLLLVIYLLNKDLIAQGWKPV